MTSTASGAEGRGPGRLLADPLRATAWALVILAAGFAAWSGWSWYHAAHAGPPTAAQVRDQALQAGEQAVQNFNTLDYRTVGQGLRLWEQSSTGTLNREITAGAAQFEKQVKQARTVTTAKILDGALTSLNVRAGTATIMVALQITVTPPHGTPAVKQNRLLGTLTRTPAGWKLSALAQAPVGAASSGKSG
jgi:Mce-associated membrane protein